MAINMKDLNKLAKFARKNGITNLKIEGIEIQVHPAYLSESVIAKDTTPEMPVQPQYTDEEIINWSSTTYIGAN